MNTATGLQLAVVGLGDVDLAAAACLHELAASQEAALIAVGTLASDGRVVVYGRAPRASGGSITTKHQR